MRLAAHYQEVCPVAPMPEPQSIDDAVAKRLELTFRIGQVERQKPKSRGCDHVATHAKRVARPLLLKHAFDDMVMLLRGDRERAIALIDAEFTRGWSKRYLDDWTVPAPTDEERHLWALLSTGPTSVDAGGVRKRRQRAVEWFEKQGRVVEKRRD